MPEVRGKLAAWRYDYNHHRPHSALNDQTPEIFQPKTQRQKQKARPSGRAFCFLIQHRCVRAYPDSNNPLSGPETLAKGSF